MRSLNVYWQYARECAKRAAAAKYKEEHDLFVEMAKAWTNVALVDGDVTKLVLGEAGQIRSPWGHVGAGLGPSE
jgi:hypothetical protein